MTETAFTTEVLRWLRTFRWLAFHVRNSGFAGKSYVQGDKGFIDILAVRDTRWIAAELKVGKEGTLLGEPRLEQRMWMAALGRVGAEAYVWRPADLPRIVEILR
jgi:hypothetical protein